MKLTRGRYRTTSAELSEDDAELLQDLQEYFGYPFNRLVPRISEILSLQHHPIGGAVVEGAGDVPTGREILRFHATEYFKTMAAEADTTTCIPPENKAAWVADEVAKFSRSLVVRTFACTWMHLAPYVSRYALLDNSIAARSDVYEDVVYQLVAACYVLSSDDRARVWMAGLVHRLRQIQLALHIHELEIKMETVGKRSTEGPFDPLPLAALQGVDIYRWSSLSRRLQQRRFLADWGPAHTDCTELVEDFKPPTGEKKPPLQRAAATAGGVATEICRTLQGLASGLAEGLRKLEPSLPRVERVPNVERPTTPRPTAEYHPRINRRPRRRKVFSREETDESEHWWRPPGACFMAPRRVPFKPGEYQQHYLRDRYRSRDDMRVKIRYDPNTPPPTPPRTPPASVVASTDSLGLPPVRKMPVEEEDLSWEPMQFNLRDERGKTALTAKLSPHRGAVRAELQRHATSTSSSDLPPGVHAFDFYQEEGSPRVAYRGVGRVVGGRRLV